MSDLYQCGASLIAPQVVLTSAECVESEENLYVRCGEFDAQGKTKTEPLPHQQEKVLRVLVSLA